MDNFVTDLLDYSFVDLLQKEARKLSIIDRAKSGKQWLFGELVNAEWKIKLAELERDDLADEITKDHFLQECSRAINHGLPFPVISESGETLRRWCEVAESYAKMPALPIFREVLSFDHFFQARRLANDPNCKLLAPDIALAEALRNKWTANEMVFHYSPKEPVHEYDKVISWLDNLQSVKLDWIKDSEKRKQAQYHLDQFRQIVSKKG